MKQFWNKDNWDYNEYVNVQTVLNKEKIKGVWIKESEIKFISKFITGSGICHGARNGFEVRIFRQYVNDKVIGTDISDNANKYGLIQWDFHNENKVWINRFDFVYTNSLDHSYDPERAIKVMMGQIKLGGKCIIHVGGVSDLLRNKADCFCASHEEFMKMFSNYKVEFHKTGYKNRIIYILQ